MAIPIAVVAALAAGLFAGAAVYITFVEHPARLSCGPAVALAEIDRVRDLRRAARGLNGAGQAS